MRRIIGKVIINPIACDGHGICVELLPEMLQFDDWGYPRVIDAELPFELLDHAKMAERLCPTLALSIQLQRTNSRT